jgi:4-aminobutyrate aminotransferase-like enzyme
VLDILKEEALPARAEKLGNRLVEAFRRLQAKHIFVGDVRGKGLMIGIEIVKDRTSKAPAADLTKKLSAALKDKGVIVGTTGVYGCVIRLTPPLVLTDDQVAQAIDAFEAVFAKAA